MVLQERSAKPCEDAAAYHESMLQFGKLAGDGNHSAPAGAYLAACVFHAVIHHESPEGLPASLTPALISPNPEGLPDAGTVAVPAADAALMQEIAWKTASDWRRKTKAWYLKPGLRR